MKQVLILHAWFAHPDDHWYPWLKKELEAKGYNVLVPELIDKDKPTLKDWTRCVFEDLDGQGDLTDQNGKENNRLNRAKHKDRLDRFVVVGHSLGAVLALRLAEKYKIDKLVLVAGWDFWDLTPEHETFFKKPIDHERIKQNVKKIVVIYSDRDPYSTVWQGEQFAKRLGAKFVLVKGKGHFTKSDGAEEAVEVLKQT